ncbi:MAG: enoyl-CoA hydratase-related protein [Bdellovibrionales bacterium]|nr:enoyl-CoA hydratase-related protein [Bdellovibrionales bacterium]
MNLFPFGTFSVDVLLPKRSFLIKLKSELINQTFIKEWEEFLEWLAIHTEVNSIYIEPEGSHFFQGLDEKEIKDFSPNQLQQHLNRIQKIIYTHFLLPQTIIMDLKEGAEGIGAEFSAGADIRLARAGCKFKLNHLEKALVPSCGGIGILGALLNKSLVWNWVMSSKNINHFELKNSGYILDYYTTSNEDIKNELFDYALNIAPIARIQSKRSLLETIQNEMNRTLKFEQKYSHANLSLNDWKKSIQNECPKKYCKAEELKKMLNEEVSSISNQ